MSEKRQSTLSEKITAAATVATALAAAKTAEEAAKSRREMEAMNEAMQLSSAKQEYIQLRMAAERRFIRQLTGLEHGSANPASDTGNFFCIC